MIIIFFVLQWPNGRLQMYSQPSSASAVSASCLTDSALDMDTGRQEAAEMRKFMVGLRPYLPPPQVARDAVKLLHMLQSSPEKKTVFLMEGGVVTLIELLNFRDSKVSAFCSAVFTSAFCITLREEVE